MYLGGIVEQPKGDNKAIEYIKAITEAIRGVIQDIKGTKQPEPSTPTEEIKKQYDIPSWILYGVGGLIIYKLLK